MEAVTYVFCERKPTHKVELPGVTIRSTPWNGMAALYVQLAKGSDFVFADNGTAEYVRTLVRTDMQLAFTHASRVWMALNG